MLTGARRIFPALLAEWRFYPANPRFSALSAACGTLLGLAALRLELPLVGSAHLSLLPAALMLTALLAGWLPALCSAVLVSLLGQIIEPNVTLLALLAMLAVTGGEMLRRGVGPVIVTALQFVPLLLLETEVVPMGRAGLPALAASAVAASVNVALATTALVCIPRRCQYVRPHTRVRLGHILFVLIAGIASLTASALLAWSGDAHTPAGWAPAEVVALKLFFIAVATLVLSSVLATRFEAATRRMSGVLTVRPSAGLRSHRQELPLEVAGFFLGLARDSNTLRRDLDRRGESLSAAVREAHQLRRDLRRANQEKDQATQSLARRTTQAHRAMLLAETALARYRALLGASGDVTIFATSDGVIDSVSANAQAALGYAPNELQGKPLGVLISPDCVLEHPLDTQSLSAVEEGKEPIVRESTVRTAGGEERTVVFHVSAFSVRNVRQYVVWLREPGKMKTALATLEQARNITASAHLSRDLFIATMSHELRTPLHGLIATLEMLRVDSSAPPEFQQRLSIARISARSLLKIANDILDLTRIDSGHFTLERRLFGLRRLLEEIVEESRARADAAGITVTSEVSDALPPAFHGDPDRLKQIVTNLLSNAIKFTRHGGVTMNVSYDGSQITIDIVDTGEGIPDDKRVVIFDPFVQVESGRHGGTGLGLPISLRLAQAMGGNLILLRSGPGGSTFRLTLCLEPSDDTPADEQSQRIFTNPRGRILVVEDNAANRYVAEALLASLECPTTIVESGADALALLEKQEFDLILMDCQMPGLDGYETTRRARRMLRTRTPIIAMTANAMADDKTRCLEAGMDDFLPKPFGRPALNDVLCKWLEPGRGRTRTGDPMDKLQTLPDVDEAVFNDLRESLQWKREPLQRICTTFVSSAQNALPLLDGSAGTDRRTLSRHLHTLVGSSGMVGARQVEFIARHLQAALAEGKLDQAAAVSSKLRDCVRRFQVEFERRVQDIP